MFRTMTAVLAIVGVIVAFVESASARPSDGYSYSSRGCMYNGYPCSEWGRPDAY
jgi:hypothetical protein